MSVFRRKKKEEDAPSEEPSDTEAPQEEVKENQSGEDVADTGVPQEEIKETQSEEDVADAEAPSDAGEPKAETAQEETPEGDTDEVPEEEPAEEDDSDRYLHRKVRYRRSSWFGQMTATARLELRLQIKSNRAILTFMAFAAMAAIVLTSAMGSLMKTLGSFVPSITDAFGPSYTALILALLPFMVCLYAARTSKSIPRDFREKHAYIYLTQPLSRSAFCIGRFVAAYIPMALTITMAFLLAAALSTDRGGIDADLMLRCLGLCLLSAFAMTATIMSMSAKKNKGSTFRGLVVLIAGIPLLYLLITNIDLVLPLLGIEYEMTEEMMDSVKDFAGYLLYAPIYGPDVSLLWMQGTGVEVSFLGIQNTVMMVQSRNNQVYGLLHGLDATVLCIVYTVWGAFFLWRMIRKVSRRELT